MHVVTNGGVSSTKLIVKWGSGGVSGALVDKCVNNNSPERVL